MNLVGKHGSWKPKGIPSFEHSFAYPRRIDPSRRYAG